MAELTPPATMKTLYGRPSVAAPVWHPKNSFLRSTCPGASRFSRLDFRQPSSGRIVPSRQCQCRRPGRPGLT